MEGNEEGSVSFNCLTDLRVLRAHLRDEAIACSLLKAIAIRRLRGISRYGRTISLPIERVNSSPTQSPSVVAVEAAAARLVQHSHDPTHQTSDPTDASYGTPPADSKAPSSAAIIKGPRLRDGQQALTQAGAPPLGYASSNCLQWHANPWMSWQLQQQQQHVFWGAQQRPQRMIQPFHQHAARTAFVTPGWYMPPPYPAAGAEALAPADPYSNMWHQQPLLGPAAAGPPYMPFPVMQHSLHPAESM
ncbi:hypothetical protein CEUSTIGMA_g4088.t1 [Chlamydomonas eustigma]|uniref:Uncharacterized protein n=1 Tax=Chlamydomonas eustigma TaxID=1157962 RepID=A0A250X178_9CHLO|nr:hypothetical protein CEUSTIGMA_g4088.t1 [Chlamydomonas eustigma]|eukprot:GAX76642.1 hypothetical protein CEUSTIGMA_g4088.t1 [Chlamydomonas eustigma]